METPLVSLVIPCYNEGENVCLLIKRLASLSELCPMVEFLLVDNGSTDGTSGLFIDAAESYHNISTLRVDKNQGYGFGILRGLGEARGIYLGWTHADMQTDPADVLLALSLLDAERSSKRFFFKGLRRGRPLGDRFFTAGMGVFESALFLCPLWDINAQPNLFHRELFESWKNPPHDFSLDLYALVAAHKKGYDIRRFPVKFADRAHGHSSWNISWRAKLKFIRRTIEYSLKLRRGISSW